MSTSASKKVIVVGGDGFCGWPTSLRLSNKGHQVVIVDSLIRRQIDEELGASSLTPIQPMEVRLDAWREVSGKEIRFVKMDVAKDYAGFLQLLKEERPEVVVDFGKLRAAPYSMKTAETKNLNVFNNLMSTQHILAAVVESGLDIHLIHLGTMGVYGYGNPASTQIPEGYLEVLVRKGEELHPWTILHPAFPGSIYHLTKCQEALFFQFYNKNDGLRITDLHQGIVWGTNTAETKLDERLINRFDYDGDYGTVLNRFLVQAALGHPLTVYGKGGQKRAFIHIRDTVACIELAMNNPPRKGDKVHIYNQMTETHQVGELATMVSQMTGVPVTRLSNPRLESAENELDVCNDKFISYGLNPTTLNDKLMEEVLEITKKYSDRVNKRTILPSSAWRKDIVLDSGVSSN